MRIAGIVLVLLIALPFSVQAKGEDVATQALGGVQAVASTIFNSIESFRLMVYTSAADEIARIKEARRMQEERLQASVDREVNVDVLITEQARPKTDNLQVEDTSGVLDGIIMQSLQVGAFIFGTVFVFYPLLILILFFVIRFLWRRTRRVA